MLRNIATLLYVCPKYTPRNILNHATYRYFSITDNGISKEDVSSRGVLPTQNRKTTKKKDIKPVVNIEMYEEDLEEKFSRSSGPGGQSVNKTNSRVQLTHLPTNITITCQEQRDLMANRKIARRKLKEQLDLYYNGEQSKIAKKIEKIKKRKSKAKRRARQKYGKEDQSSKNEEGINDSDEEEEEEEEEGTETIK